MTPTEVYLREQNFSLRTLVVVCRGLRDCNGKPLLDISENPWTKLASSLVKPNTAEYGKEIERRWIQKFGNSDSNTAKAPRPKAWKLDKLLEWLDSHPICAEDDIEYLRATVNNRKKEVEDTTQFSASNNTAEQRNWTGKQPHLRLIHCLIDNDEVKQAYLRRNDIPQGRLHIDNRNSVEKRNKSVWEMMADQFNDPDFNPVTEELPMLHSDFINSEDIGYSTVEDISQATPEKCQSKFTAMILQMNRCITKWERSGQGEGGHLDSNIFIL